MSPIVPESPQLFPGHCSIEPLGNRCVVEVLYSPTEFEKGFLPQPPLPPLFSAGDLCIGIVNAVGEKLPDALAQIKPDYDVVNETLKKMAGVFGTMIGGPEVSIGELVIFQGGSAQKFPIQGFEKHRLLDLRDIVARLHPDKYPEPEHPKTV